jgi:ketosteroid isomerase-like protein
MPSPDRVRDLIALVERGEFVAAIEEFYAEDATMQENSLPPRRGKARLVEHERAVLAAFASARTLPVEAWLVDGDRAAIHWVFEFTRHDGTVVRFDEVALQRWRGDHIVEEHFFYDPPR